MKKRQPQITDPDLKRVLPALERAAAKAKELARQTSTPFYIFKAGKIINLNKPKVRRVA